MKRMTDGDLQALELLMQTTPGFEHFDSGADGILPECRSCRFHRPFWKYQSCVFAECPYVDAPDKSSGKRRQKVHIEYDLVGYIPVDELLKAEQA